MNKDIKTAIELIKNSKYIVAFTGAGISQESGIPSFRGKDGLWSKYNPNILELDFYKRHTQESWKIVKEIFYDYFNTAIPNKAHIILADWESKSIIKSVITQNIDSLHQKAGSKNVIEYHGTNSTFICLNCAKSYSISEIIIQFDYPTCSACGGKLKPGFIFFGESIPEIAQKMSQEEIDKTDLVIIIGTTGEVYPAAYLPFTAKKRGAKIIEINPESSNFTHKISDLTIYEKSSKVLQEIDIFLDF